MRHNNHEILKGASFDVTPDTNALKENVDEYNVTTTIMMATG